MPANTAQLRALPQFMRFLSAFPHPATVPRSLVLGPLTAFNAAGGYLAFQNGDALHTMGAYGFSEEEMDRYAVVPIDLASPLTTAFIEGEIVVQPLAEVVTGYNFTDLDPQLWEAMIERVGDGDMVCAPVTAQGTAFGALGFVTRSTRTWTNADIAYLDGLSSILGIWATHHLSGVRTPEVWRPVTQDTLTLSPRQLDILRLVELGKSNAAIAFALGYSASTVKAELQRVLRVLKVGDRQAAVATARELGLLSDPEEVTAG